MYTNYAFLKTVNYSIYAAKILNKTYDNSWNKLVENVYIPYDEEMKYHPEYDGYNIGTRIKQADVAMLQFPWSFDYNNDNNIFYNDLEYYLNVTDVGMDMTWPIYTIGWLKYGKPEMVKQSFPMSYQNNLKGPFKIWTESAQGTGSQDWYVTFLIFHIHH